MTSPPRARAVVAALACLMPEGSGPPVELLQAGVARAAAAWPAEVLARCVVLAAHQRGGPRALRPLGTPAVVALWQRSLDEVLGRSADSLTGWLGEKRFVVVRCGTAPHRLRLDGSQVIAVSHAPADLASEQVAAALGGRPSACVHALTHWPSPGPSRGPVAALVWLALVREWTAQGVGPESSGVAVDEHVWPSTVLAHRAAGLTLEQAVTWRHTPAGSAARWLALGASRQQAASWTARRREVGDLEAGVRELVRRGLSHGTAVRHLLAWTDAVPALDVAGLLPWIGPGREASTWGEVAARGMNLKEATAWQRHGFGPVEVLRYQHLRVPVRTARAWRAAGVPAREAAQHIADGTRLGTVTLVRP